MVGATLNSISLFSGVGMLDCGVAAGLRHLGIAHRTVCYVEREAFACSQLVALMEAGCMDAAPIWSDVTTFPAKQFRGLVGLIVGGFPCQDISIAGKRSGLDGNRSGLFFNILDIADDCDAPILFLENVAAISTANASVVDEEEGELTERAASRIMGELADRGWDAEWMHVRASDVGASHQRERWFCLAVRQGRGLGELRQSSGRNGLTDRRDEGLEALGHAGHDARNAKHGQQSEGATCRARESGADHGELDDPTRNGGNRPHRESGSWRGVCETGGAMANPESIRGGFRLRDEQSRRSEAESAGAAMGHPTDHERERGRLARNGSGQPANDGALMADASSSGSQGRELGRTRIGHGGGAGSTWIN